MAPKKASAEDELYQLELLSLTGKVATELLNHTGINDRVLAEFILSLHDSATSVADFKAKLSEVGADFPDAFVANLDRLILRLHPKHKKAAAKPFTDAQAGSSSPSTKGKQKATHDDEERQRRARMFPGLAINDQDWQPSQEKEKGKGHAAVDEFMKEFEDLASAKSSNTTTRSAPEPSRGSSTRAEYDRAEPSSRRGRDERPPPHLSRPPPDDRPQLYKIYDGRVSNMRDFGAFVSLEGLRGPLRRHGPHWLHRCRNARQPPFGSPLPRPEGQGQEMAEERERVAARSASGANSAPLGGARGANGNGNGAGSGIAVKEDGRGRSIKRLTSPERWELRQLIASGVAKASDYPELMEEDLRTPNTQPGADSDDEEIDIEVLPIVVVLVVCAGLMGWGFGEDSANWTEVGSVNFLGRVGPRLFADSLSFDKRAPTPFGLPLEMIRASTVRRLRPRWPRKASGSLCWIGRRTALSLRTAHRNDLNKIVRADYTDANFCTLAKEAIARWRSSPVLRQFYHEVGVLFRSSASGDVWGNEGSAEEYVHKGIKHAALESDAHLEVFPAQEKARAYKLKNDTQVDEILGKARELKGDGFKGMGRRADGLL
ncbi:hypothetical protein L1887_57818 [Cichorium endivia]|nr:hypothetical protein L1887_57818 [Cichorium endivia]